MLDMLYNMLDMLYNMLLVFFETWMFLKVFD